MVELYLLAPQNIERVRGEAFNIGGGLNNSLSLLEFFELLENKLEIKIEYKQLPARASDQKIFVADIDKIYRFIGWQPKVTKEDGIQNMLLWLQEIL
jgi:CDP-paratose 2-epimerase